LAQVTYARYHRGAWGEASRFLPQPGFQVYAERGAAWIEMPDRIQWTDEKGSHEERLPLEPTVGEVLNDQFHRMVRGEQSLAPPPGAARAVAGLVGALRGGGGGGRGVVPGWDGIESSRNRIEGWNPTAADGSGARPSPWRRRSASPCWRARPASRRPPTTRWPTSVSPPVGGGQATRRPSPGWARR